MKIIFCQHLSARYYAGGEQEVCELAQEMMLRGHDVEVRALPYMMGERPRISVKEVLKDITYHEAWVHVIRDFDIAYVFYHPLNRLNFILKGGKTILAFPSMLWFSLPWKGGYSFIPRLAWAISRFTIIVDTAFYDAIHVHFDYQKTKLRRWLPFDKEVYVIPHWVDTEMFRPLAPKSDIFTVIYLGRPTPQKGFDLFIKIARDLSSKNIRFMIIGKELKLKNIIGLPYIGSRRKLAKILSSSHLLVSPQRVETFGRTVLEALACGTPAIVLSRVMSDRRLENVVWFAHDIQGIKKGIETYFNTWRKGNYHMISDQARQTAELFSRKKIMNMFERTFKKLAQNL